MTNVFYIEIIPPHGAHQQVVVGSTILIGRSPRRCNVAVDDARVSRIHLRISRHPETGITVTDLFSANGTTIDGRSLPPGLPFHWLMGQEIKIGDTRLTLWYGDLALLDT